MAYQSQDSEVSSFFRNPVLRRYLKGLKNVQSPDATMVLTPLMKLPLDLMATSDLRLMTYKTMFLDAVISTHRASELCSHWYDLYFLQFYENKVSLFLDLFS